MMFIGTISFSLYLWHTIFMMTSIDARLFGEPSAWKSFAIAALYVLPPTLIASYASYRWVELPFLRIRHHAKGHDASWFNKHPIQALLGVAVALVLLTWIANFALTLNK